MCDFIDRIKKISFCFIILFLLNGCQDEPFEWDACQIAVIKTNEAASNLTNASDENYTAYCLIYRDALLKQIEVCGDPLGELQRILDDLGDCSVDYDRLCAEAIAATEIAEANFNNASDLDYKNLCENYRAAILYQIEVCGEDENLLGIIENLGNCELQVVPIIGIWKLQFWLSGNPLDINNDGIATTSILSEFDCYQNELITFLADGTGSFSYNSYATITYTPNFETSVIDQVDYFVTCTDFEDTVNFTWTQSGNNFILTLLETEEVIYYLRDSDFLTTNVTNGFTATNTNDSSQTITEDIKFIFSKQ
ncbi:hypothetical protein [Winogradskyella ursingii]|uniref:hypothetical protein n=1 Tax=Winogradskyella ursingii TaxID=2686079 RepID=UPI0015CD5D0C|nr:hypothetical protein [Winogradskyella ursingii]